MAELKTIDGWDELVRVVTDEPHLFVRFSEGPGVDRETGVSRDYEAGIDLPGLSVTTIGPEPWWSRPAEDWIARRLCKYADLGVEEERFPWLLTGTQVGVGPDHEPLIRGWEPVARISEHVVDEATRRYHDRFDVGQDSRQS